MIEHILQMNLEIYIENNIVPSNDTKFDLYDYMY